MVREETEEGDLVSTKGEEGAVGVEVGEGEAEFQKICAEAAFSTDGISEKKKISENEPIFNFC